MVAKKKAKVTEPVIEVTKPKKVKVAKTESYPKVVKGTHLTVTTYEDGSTELEWDDDQLLKEIRAACASVETKKKPNVKVKTETTKKKKVSK